MPNVTFQWKPREEVRDNFYLLFCDKELPIEPVEGREISFPITAGVNSGDEIEFKIAKVGHRWTTGRDIITIVTLELTGVVVTEEEEISCHEEALEELTKTYGWQTDAEIQVSASEFTGEEWDQMEKAAGSSEGAIIHLRLHGNRPTSPKVLGLVIEDTRHVLYGQLNERLKRARLPFRLKSIEKTGAMFCRNFKIVRI